MELKKFVQQIFRKIGYDISRFNASSNPLARRKHLLQFYAIDTILDIGANSGQFGLQLRKELGYTNQIISFEPLSSAYRVLESNAKNDPFWEVLNIALGDSEKLGYLNVSQNSYSSSLLDILPTHLDSEPESKFITKEKVHIKTLDSLFENFCLPEDNIYLKIDAQGFEYQVLNGAINSLKEIDTIQLEMSLVPLYEGEMPFIEMHNFMHKNNYNLVSIEPGFSDPKSGELLQADGIFHRAQKL